MKNIMTNKNRIAKSLVASAGMVALLAGFAFTASAQTVGASTTLTTSQQSTLQTIITRSNTEIAQRITSLNALAARIASFKNEPASEVQSIASEVQTTIATLNGIQAKVDADTTLASARADEATIFGNVRVYALVIPQGYEIASSDRITTIVGLMNAIQVKLQPRITAAQNSGLNVAAMQAAMTDMTAKMNDATSQASAIQSGVSGLVPDQGNKTILASNTAALVAAHANVKTATSDLLAARQDIRTIINALEA